MPCNNVRKESRGWLSSELGALQLLRMGRWRVNWAAKYFKSLCSISGLKGTETSPRSSASQSMLAKNGWRLMAGPRRSLRRLGLANSWCSRSWAVTEIGCLNCSEALQMLSCSTLLLSEYHGTSPISISYNSMPKLHQSFSQPYASPRTISGLMYGSVPQHDAVLCG